MNVIQAFFLGLVQGLTEFLPISSSGHLVLGEHLLNIQSGDITFEVAVHIGTLLAVLVYFRQDLCAVVVDFFRGGKMRRAGWMLLLATVPTGLIGFGFKDLFESLFAAPRFAAAGLLVTSLILFLAEKIKRGDRPLSKVRSLDALLVGLLQGFAIIPGISRSGSTIAAGLWVGMSRDAAARFSFLLSIPAILGAAVLQAGDFQRVDPGQYLPMAVGIIASAISGYLAIGILMRVLRQGKLYGFSIYTSLVGILGLLFL